MTATTNGSAPAPVQVAEVAELVALLADQVLAVSARAGRAPSTIRVSAGQVEIEVAWPTIDHPSAETTATGNGSPVARPVPATPAELPSTVDTSGTFPLCSGTVGVFYRSSEPGVAPFVVEGDVVRPGQQVGIVEAMKLMIPVEADRAGRITEALVTDGTAVEHGQPLFLLAEADA
jgi:acetyl-CoA carboxylase biotin carboxyl carrier protein